MQPNRKRVCEQRETAVRIHSPAANFTDYAFDLKAREITNTEPSENSRSRGSRLASGKLFAFSGVCRGYSSGSKYRRRRTEFINSVPDRGISDLGLVKG